MNRRDGAGPVKRVSGPVKKASATHGKAANVPSARARGGGLLPDTVCRPTIPRRGRRSRRGSRRSHWRRRGPGTFLGRITRRPTAQRRRRRTRRSTCQGHRGDEGSRLREREDKEGRSGKTLAGCVAGALLRRAHRHSCCPAPCYTPWCRQRRRGRPRRSPRRRRRKQPARWRLGPFPASTLRSSWRCRWRSPTPHRTAHTPPIRWPP